MRWTYAVLALAGCDAIFAGLLRYLQGSAIAGAVSVTLAGNALALVCLAAMARARLSPTSLVTPAPAAGE